MMTRQQVMAQVAALAGDPYYDWLTEAYFSGFCNVAYQQAIQYLLSISASPLIEQRVIIPQVQLGVDESNLLPNAQNQNTYPLGCLIKPRLVEFKLSVQSAQHFREAREFEYLPDTVQQVTPQVFDFRITGDFMPPPLLKDTDRVLVHPNGGFALAFSIMGLIAMERGNATWVEQYGTQAQEAWDAIGADIIKQQQHLTFRLGSPNRSGRNWGWAYNLQGNVGWSWRSYTLYAKMI